MPKQLEQKSVPHHASRMLTKLAPRQAWTLAEVTLIGAQVRVLGLALGLRRRVARRLRLGTSREADAKQQPLERAKEPAAVEQRIQPAGGDAVVSEVRPGVVPRVVSG
jgi:hypothetical protein